MKDDQIKNATLHYILPHCVIHIAFLYVNNFFFNIFILFFLRQMMELDLDPTTFRPTLFLQLHSHHMCQYRHMHQPHMCLPQLPNLYKHLYLQLPPALNNPPAQPRPQGPQGRPHKPHGQPLLARDYQLLQMNHHPHLRPQPLMGQPPSTWNN